MLNCGWNPFPLPSLLVSFALRNPLQPHLTALPPHVEVDNGFLGQEGTPTSCKGQRGYRNPRLRPVMIDRSSAGGEGVGGGEEWEVGCHQE